jgi:hypothetical protein
MATAWLLGACVVFCVGGKPVPDVELAALGAPAFPVVELLGLAPVTCGMLAAPDGTSTTLVLVELKFDCAIPILLLVRSKTTYAERRKKSPRRSVSLIAVSIISKSVRERRANLATTGSQLLAPSSKLEIWTAE